MGSLSVFDNASSRSLDSYKDAGYKQQSDKTRSAMNQTKILAIPAYIYKHLNKYNGPITANLQNHLSYEDIAFLIRVNEILDFNPGVTSGLLSSLTDAYKTNVEFLLKTERLNRSVKNYLDIITDGESNPYKIVNIENNILVIIEGGLLSKLNDKEVKELFLKELCEMCFNVMGDGNTSAQPFFKEFVDIL